MIKSRLVGRGSPEYLKRELDRARQLIAVLRTQLMHEDIDSINKPPEWTEALSPQEIVLMGLLLKNHPRAASRNYLEEALPKLDHVKERKSHCLDVIVNRTRETIGCYSIETIRGFGYRCSDEFAEKYKHTLK